LSESQRMERSEVMRRVHGTDTGPEKKVRKLVTALGFSYRLNRQNLPGCPDIVLSGQKKIIFVHGCFWHGHNCVRGARVPKQNRTYWKAKIAKNVSRDRKSIRALRTMGWGVMVIWECALPRLDALRRRLQRFLAA